MKKGKQGAASTMRLPPAYGLWVSEDYFTSTFRTVPSLMRMMLMPR